MTNQCKKGKRVELEIAHFLQEHGLPSARRTQQHNGAEGLSDVVAIELPEWHIESKGTCSTLLNKSTLTKWLAQITRDCPEAMKAVIIHKANGKDLVAILPYKVFLHHKGSRNIQEKVIIRESFYPSNELLDMDNQYKVGLAVGLSIATGQPPINVCYYMIGDQVLVFMWATEWLKLIGV